MFLFRAHQSFLQELQKILKRHNAFKNIVSYKEASKRVQK
ncbi:hypothetical protein BLL69_2337 [Lacticaseibacillus paracasei]|nr:hypothetical protein BLL69_2337 [Lacticaseibacillus paracasei]